MHQRFFRDEIDVLRLHVQDDLGFGFVADADLLDLADAPYLDTVVGHLGAGSIDNPERAAIMVNCVRGQKVTPEL